MLVAKRYLNVTIFFSRFVGAVPAEVRTRVGGSPEPVHLRILFARPQASGKLHLLRSTEHRPQHGGPRIRRELQSPSATLVGSKQIVSLCN